MKKILRTTRFLAASAMLLVGWSVWSALVIPDCPPPTGGDITLIVNHENCSSFWECNGGTPHLVHCPDFLFYCPARQYCSWQWDAICTYDCTMILGGKGAYVSCPGRGSGCSATYVTMGGTYTEDVLGYADYIIY